MGDKQQLRNIYKQQLEALAPEEYRRKSDTIASKLCAVPEYIRAKAVFCYVATTLEVDTSAIIKKILADGKTLAVPRIENDAIIPKRIDSPSELVPGPFDILQPGTDAPYVRVDDLDLVIVPGLAFTQAGARLGRGGGYFDRWLPNLSKKVPTVGLAFDFQIADTLPQKPHDVAVSSIISS